LFIVELVIIAAAARAAKMREARTEGACGYAAPPLASFAALLCKAAKQGFGELRCQFK